ncbi:hypothetical protein J2T12_002725 [Paenibacillus anaericanus]|uniref:hypothetical protein n=1 Tax=Paenibacillus anaericanus TaxID=170367 RepID=UPI002782D39D|nr:hypothetical protein [Paenibacillus anaericanus]MDQ0089313.1 hypothetical protein [Paenibacillus anaericanus]
MEDMALELDIPAKTLHAWKAKYRDFSKQVVEETRTYIHCRSKSYIKLTGRIVDYNKTLS